MNLTILDHGGTLLSGYKTIISGCVTKTVSSSLLFSLEGKAIIKEAWCDCSFVVDSDFGAESHVHECWLITD